MTHVVVVGASGLVGRAAVGAFLDKGWRVTAVSRRTPDVSPDASYAHLAVDIFDPTLPEYLRVLDAVTHLVFAASYETASLVQGWSDPEQMETNLRMFTRVLGPISEGRELRHVTLMQGTKAYGVHLHPIPVPARERHPRDPHENFYWLQEEFLRRAANECGFSWTILRPVGVVGPAFGVRYSIASVIGAFAALCHREGRAFGFPGGAIYPARQVVDVRLVANAVVWAATAKAAAAETFNLTNGEVVSWEDLWPVLADILAVEAGPPAPLSMRRHLRAGEEAWSQIVSECDLRPLSLAEVVGQSDQYADYTFGYETREGPPALVSSIKVKQAGFTEVRDTEETFRNALEGLVEQRVIPGRKHRSVTL